MKFLGAAVAAGASIIPITLGLDAMRQLFFTAGAEDAFLSLEAELALLVGLCALFMVLAQLLARGTWSTSGRPKGG